MRTLDSDEECTFGERAFGYQTGNYAANRPDHVSPGECAETILTCNAGNVRGVFHDARAYRTYAQCVSFVGMNNSRDFNRAEFLIDIINELAGYDGRISGQVLNNMTGEPVEGARVEVMGCNLIAITDEEGMYEINPLPYAEFEIQITGFGYTTHTTEVLNFDGENVLELDYRLLHPELALNPEVLSLELEQDDFSTSEIVISNAGDGPLEYSTRVRSSIVPGQLWSVMTEFDAGQRLEDTRLQAAIYFQDYYWFAGGNSGAREPNMYYKVNRDGEVVDQWLQNTESNYGWRDLTTDGEYIYAADSDHLTQIDPETGEATDFEIPTPFRPTYSVTYDPANDLFWVCSSTSNLVAIDREGETIAEINNGRRFRINGLCWNENDPDGYNLYIMSRDSERQQELVKVNTEDGESQNVIMFSDFEEEATGGGEITTELFPFTTTLVLQMQGREDYLRAFEAGSDFYWVGVDPPEAVIDAEGNIEMEIAIATEDLRDDQEYQAYIHFEHNTMEEEAICIEILLTLGEPGLGMQDLTVPMPEGWSIISINVDPMDFYANEDANGPDIIQMCDQLRIDDRNHHVEILKDDLGRFYSPAFGFNNIPYWKLDEGYQVKVDEDVEADWSGVPIPADSDVELLEGWNLIAYFPTYNLDASGPDFYALSPIIDVVELAKDGIGRFMLPEMNFSNMVPWQETEGYQVKVSEDVTLNYPAEGEEVASSNSNSENRPSLNTGINMSVLVSSQLTFGSEITAIDKSGRIVGTGSVDSDGYCGLAIWGDDPTTEMVDGLLAGEEFSLKSGNGNYLVPQNFTRGTDLTFETDGYTALEISSQSFAPDVYALSEAYPNPFNNVTRLQYNLPASGHVSITVNDIAGRTVATLVNTNQQAGSHQAVWDATSQSSGIYLLQMKAGDFTAVKKVMLVK